MGMDSGHAGQMCSASSRIFVQEGIYDVFMQHMVAAAQAMQPGTGFDTDMTKVDPIVSKTQYEVRIVAHSTFHN